MLTVISANMKVGELKEFLSARNVKYAGCNKEELERLVRIYQNFPVLKGNVDSTTNKSHPHIEIHEWHNVLANNASLSIPQGFTIEVIIEYLRTPTNSLT